MCVFSNRRQATGSKCHPASHIERWRWILTMCVHALVLEFWRSVLWFFFGFLSLVGQQWDSLTCHRIYSLLPLSHAVTLESWCPFGATTHSFVIIPTPFTLLKLNHYFLDIATDRELNQNSLDLRAWRTNYDPDPSFNLKGFANARGCFPFHRNQWLLSSVRKFLSFVALKPFHLSQPTCFSSTLLMNMPVYLIGPFTEKA